MYYLILILIFVIGTVVGSFLNVVVYRVPRKESIVYPPSRCPHCGQRLAWYDMIPIISYMVLGGRCRYCGHKISWKYPLVEFITGLWTLVVFILFFPNDWFAMVEVLVFGYFSIALSIIDIEHYILPNVILLVMGLWELAWVGVGFVFGLESIHDIVNRIIGALVLLMFFVLIYYLVPGGMGEGDVKLSPIIGWFLGFPKIVPWFFIAFGMGALWGVIVIMIKWFINKEKASHILPFGPFMLWGAILAWFYGIPMILWYRRLFLL